MTTVFFLRHAQSDPAVFNSPIRPLTAYGMETLKDVQTFFAPVPIHRVFSSPYKRAVDTVRPVADARGLPILTDKAFTEFHAGKCGRSGDEFFEYVKECFQKTTLSAPGGESLGQLQNRQLKSLYAILRAYPDRNILVGTHGLALAALIHRFYPSFGFQGFLKINPITPLVAAFTFQNEQLVCISLTDPVLKQKIFLDNTPNTDI